MSQTELTHLELLREAKILLLYDPVVKLVMSRCSCSGDDFCLYHERVAAFIAKLEKVVK